MDDYPADILRAAEEALDKLLCNDNVSCGGTAGLRQASINDIAEAILAERQACITKQAEEIRLLRDAATWKPIKTAPRDGKIVWLWNKHVHDKANAPQRYFWSTNYSIFGLGGCWTDGFCTMGDGIDFDFWCEALPADYANPHEAASPEAALSFGSAAR